MQLIIDRYGIHEDRTESYGVTYEELRRATADGTVDELIGRVVERFRALEAHFDAMVCVGSAAVRCRATGCDAVVHRAHIVNTVAITAIQAQTATS